MSSPVLWDVPSATQAIHIAIVETLNTILLRSPQSHLSMYYPYPSTSLQCLCLNQCLTLTFPSPNLASHSLDMRFFFFLWWWQESWHQLSKSLWKEPTVLQMAMWSLKLCLRSTLMIAVIVGSSVKASPVAMLKTTGMGLTFCSKSGYALWGIFMEQGCIIAPLQQGKLISRNDL